MHYRLSFSKSVCLFGTTKCLLVSTSTFGGPKMGQIKEEINLKIDRFTGFKHAGRQSVVNFQRLVHIGYQYVRAAKIEQLFVFLFAFSEKVFAFLPKTPKSAKNH